MSARYRPILSAIKVTRDQAAHLAKQLGTARFPLSSRFLVVMGCGHWKAVTRVRDPNRALCYECPPKSRHRGKW